MNNNDHEANRIIDKVLNDKSSGATELSINTLHYLITYANSLNTHTPIECKTKLLFLASKLMRVRPSMAPLQNILAQWINKFTDLTMHSGINMAAEVQKLCDAMIADIKNRQKMLTKHATSGLEHCNTIMTISRSSAVTEVLKQLPQRPLHIIVCESRPGYEGRVLAIELAENQICVDYIIDAAISNHIDRADAVLVGADTILADGSVVNKCGTSLLAIAAKYFCIPFYVVADTNKYSGLHKDEIRLEEMPTPELAAPVSQWIYPHNIYFDITDSELVDGYFTERGKRRVYNWS